MRRNTRRNTQPELLLRRALWRLGARYRLHLATLPGRPDLVLPSAKLAVFCDGDFWHGRNWQARRRRLAQGANAAYWIPKILANRARDRRVSRQLRALGWAVVRVWESEVVEDAHKVARQLLGRARQLQELDKPVCREMDGARSDERPNNSMQRTALRAAADAERSAAQTIRTSLPKEELDECNR